MLCSSMLSLMIIRHVVIDMETRDGVIIIMVRSLFTKRKITHFEHGSSVNMSYTLKFVLCFAGIHLPEA